MAMQDNRALLIQAAQDCGRYASASQCYTVPPTEVAKYPVFVVEPRRRFEAALLTSNQVRYDLTHHIPMTFVRKEGDGEAAVLADMTAFLNQLRQDVTSPPFMLEGNPEVYWGMVAEDDVIVCAISLTRYESLDVSA